mgnify:CR=1 FL=1
MEKSLENGSYGRNGEKPFFSALPNPHPPIGGRIFCSPEQSKLCFEALETRFVPQNHLLRQLSESFKTPSEVGVLLDIKMDFIMNGKEKKEQNKGGRKPKANPSIHRYVFRLTNEENAKFLTFFEQSGMKVMAHFITACIFQKPVKTVKIDMDAVDFHTRLTNFYSQFRAVGVNYNQIVKILYRNFSEKKASAYLFKLEKQTAEMADLCRKVIELTQEFEKEHLQKHK